MSLSLLPSIAETRRITRSLAMLDAILCPEWECRYYNFNCAWGLCEKMASMRNGAGDDWFLLFNSEGAVLKGYHHEFTADHFEGVSALFAHQALRDSIVLLLNPDTDLDSTYKQAHEIGYPVDAGPLSR